jgi:hypothetical protein
MLVYHEFVHLHGYQGVFPDIVADCEKGKLPTFHRQIEAGVGDNAKSRCKFSH